MKIQFGTRELKEDYVVLLVSEGLKFSGKIDQSVAGLSEFCSACLAQQRIFKGKSGQSLHLTYPRPKGQKPLHIILVGIGKNKSLELLHRQEIGHSVYQAVKGALAEEAAIWLDEDVFDPKSKTDRVEEWAADIAYGAKLASYRFDKYQNDNASKKADYKNLCRKLTLRLANEAQARKLFSACDKLADGVFFARDLSSEPPNILYPESYAELLDKTLTPLGVKVEILDEKKLKKIGMGALLAVAQGSKREARVVVMEWPGEQDKNTEKTRDKKAAGHKPIALVGKGVTFDSGGISLKPAAGMDGMKWDMGGSAAVAGTMLALAGRKSKAHVVGIVGLVENMPSGKAYRPGDVVTSLSGKTIEVLNTDAEGRLVLADIMTYVQEQFKPREMIDLATLTGAMIVTLGHEKAGLFSNNKSLQDQLMRAGSQSGEPLWPLPLDPVYDKMIDSTIADMRNIGDKGAGSITAAQFLQRFVNKDCRWAHLDIAGMAWSDKPRDFVPKGASGFGVRLLTCYIEKYVALANANSQ